MNIIHENERTNGQFLSLVLISLSVIISFIIGANLIK